MGTMKAVVVPEHGGPEVLQIAEVPIPKLGPSDVLVKVKACALNHLDVWIRRGLPGMKIPLPRITGSDASGDIAALGKDVSDIEVGTPVMVLPNLSCGICEYCTVGLDNLCRDFHILGESCQGVMAEYVAVPRANVVQKPERFSYPQAAAVSLTFLTAWHMLVARAQLGPGETILIQAAGSGVGSAAVQIARFLGATIIGTAGSQEKLDQATALGAHHVINYREEDFAKRVKAITEGRGVDVLFEHVGGETFERAMRCLARGGRLVTCGATTGAKVNLNLTHLFFKNLSVLGSTMGSKGDYHQLVKLYNQGHFAPVIDRVLPMSEVAEGHRLLENRKIFGKIVIEP